MDATTRVATRLRRSNSDHDCYTVRVANRRVAALATAHPGDVCRWIDTNRWYHEALLPSGRLVAGLGVQWTPVRGGGTPRPATLQLCVGQRCLVFHLARVDPEAVPNALYRFLADPRVVFVGYGYAHDRQMLWDHYELHVERGRDLRELPGMRNASLDLMAHRFLGYPGIGRPSNVATSAWRAPRLSVEQVEYACVDAYLAFRLGLLLCRGAHQPVQRDPGPPPGAPPRAQGVVHRAPPRAPALDLHRAPAPALVLPRAPPPATRAQVVVHRAPPRAPALDLHRAPGPAQVLPRAPPPATRAQVIVRAPPPAPPLRAQVLHRATDPNLVFRRITPPAPRTLVPPRGPHHSPRTPVPHHAVAVDAGESSSRVAGESSSSSRQPGGLSWIRSNYASPGFTGLDTDTELYATDDDNDDLSSNESDFDLRRLLRRREAVTDDDEEEEDV